MSRKNRKKKARRRKPSAPARFSVDTPVRVKPGTKDPDFADIPLGGWAGTIREIFRQDPDDRIRAIFGLTSDDPVPNVTSETQGKYHRHLATHLAFPFPALYPVETDSFEMRNSQVTVLDLLDADEGDDTGLLCEAVVQGESVELPLADIEGVINAHNRQLIEDYSYWFYNGQGDQSGERVSLPGVPVDPGYIPPVNRAFLKILGEFGVYGLISGVLLGSLLGAIESALIGVLVGALIGGFIGYWGGAKYGRLFGLLNRLKSGPVLGGLCGALVGAILGSLAGAMAVAVLGTLAGGVLGGLAGKLAPKLQGQPLASSNGILIGAGVGAIGWAFYLDLEGASAGAVQGAWMGAGAGILLPLAFLGILFLVARRGGYLEG